MHSTNTPYIFNNNVGSFITSFLAEYNRLNPGIAVDVLVVGGSALAMKYGFRGTVDIDAEIRARNSTKEAIANVSKAMNIPNDFINEDFMKSNSYSRHLWDDAVFVYQSGLNRVWVVSDISQLCMKLTACRRKDMDDISFLLERVYQQGYGYQNIVDRFNQLYGGYVKPKPAGVNLVKRFFRKKKR